jgi:hypothetical protein
VTDAEARLIELSPKEAEAAIRANRLIQPTRVSGRLALTNFDPGRWGHRLGHDVVWNVPYAEFML